jgi:ubiquitin C-terminal hydrolase
MFFMYLIFYVYSPAAISPIKLIRAASHFNPSFHGYSQQDSMDFFRLVLDRLHEDLKYSVPSSALLDESGNRKNRRKSGRLAQKNGDSDSDSEKVQFKSVISETFGGILRSEVQCHKCNKVCIDFTY